MQDRRIAAREAAKYSEEGIELNKTDYATIEETAIE